MKTIYTINPETSALINTLTAELRAEGKRELALNVRKVYGNIKNKEFSTTNGYGVLASFTGKKVSQKDAMEAIKTMLNVLIFDEVEVEQKVVEEPKQKDKAKGNEMEKEFKVPEIEIDENYNTRYDFMTELNYDEMTAHQLGLVLFKELGAEIESKIRAMSTGAKIKFDLLDDLKEKLVELYPEIRVEVLEAKLANALAVTKLKEGTSLAIIEGNLAVYNYLATDLVVDSSNFEFMAQIGADKTKALDILILQSAFATYKEEIEKGNLPMTSNELNLAIARAITGVEPVKQSTLDKIKNLFQKQHA